jgi:DnaJ-class molecular chaperone
LNGKDYYKILGVPRTASADEIKKAHRKLARKHHPDLNPGNKAAEDRFKEIQEAYDVLSEPETRSKYDQYGEKWQRVSQNPPPNAGASRQGASGFSGATGSPFGGADTEGGGPNFEEFIAQMFGGAARTRRGANAPRSAAPSEDIEFAVDISLEDAYTGTSKRITLTVEDVCPECDGMGQKRNSRGQFELNGQACPRCKGSGHIPSQRSVEVSIPAGAWDGLRMRVAGQGAADARGRRGDLYVQLHVLPHPRFERDGQDLLFDVNIPYTVAGLGGDVSVEMLNRQLRDVIVPPGIQTGQKLRLSGQGMPALRDRRTGDAFARVRITVPRDLSAREKQLIRELAEIRKDPVRRS